MRPNIVVRSLVAATLLTSKLPMGAATFPPPARCDTRVTVQPAETATIFVGTHPRHFRLSVATIQADYSIAPISGSEMKFQGITAKLSSGVSVQVPFGLGAVDVESDNITVTNAATSKTGFFVCFESLP